MSYESRVAANIFPESIERARLLVALAEWIYTGETKDLEDITGVCELCDKARLRYHFEIENTLNQNRLDVGSECILQFRIGALVKGVRVEGEAAANAVSADRSKLIREAKFKSVIGSLRALKEASDAELDPNKKTTVPLEEFIQEYCDEQKFSPNKLATLLWRFDVHGVNYVPSHFKMRLNKKIYKEQVRAMLPWKYKHIEKSMTEAQRKTADLLRC